MPPSYPQGPYGERTSPTQDSLPSDQWVSYVPWASEDALTATEASYSPDVLFESSTEDYFSVPMTPLAYTGVYPAPSGFTGEDLRPQPWAAETDSEPYNQELFPPANDPPQRWLSSQASEQPAGASSPSDPSPPSPLSAPSPQKGPAKSPKARAKPQLRTAARTAKQRRTSSAMSVASAPSEGGADMDGDAPGTVDEVRARRNHNIVEKQYRNRLNSQFERLLAVLPHRGGSDGADPSDEDKRISKAEVLDMATNRIRLLESERRRLQGERMELFQAVESMRQGAYGGGRV